MAITKAKRFEREREEWRREQQYLLPGAPQGAMTLDQLFLILSPPPSSRLEPARRVVDIDPLLTQHTTDAEIALARSTSLDAKAQG